MKRIVIIISAIIAMATSASAMSYEQARDQALFLTDKMAYELNLTEDQYEAAYEINLDYLMSIDTYDDLYGSYWTRRNLDLSYILLSWQYRYFCNAAYFYRPLYWDGGYWHFGIYARYPHRNYYYYGCPHFVTVYRGGHSWHHNNNRSYYRGRTYGVRDGRQLNGMRDDFNNGRFGRGQKLNLSSNMPNNNNVSNSRGNFGGSRSNGSSANSDTSFGNRQSSTRTTVGNSNGNDSRNSSFGGSRSSNRISNGDVPNSTFAPKNSGNSNSSFGGSRSSSSNNGSSRSYSPSSSSSSRSNSFGGGRSSSSSSSYSPSSSSSSRNSSSFGGGRSSSSSRSYSPSSSSSSRSSSFGGGRSSSSSRSYSPSSSRSSSGSSHSSSSGSRSFGGGRR